MAMSSAPAGAMAARGLAMSWAIWLAWCACGCAASGGPHHLDEDKGASAIAQHVTAHAPAGDIGATLKAFDIFNARNRLGMALGEEKGKLVEIAVKMGLPPSGPTTVLELGCHAGDGSLHAARIASHREGSTLISAEDNELWLAAAEKIVRHATSTFKGFTFLPLRLPEEGNFGKFLDTIRNTHGIKSVDTVILDTEDLEHYSSHVAMMLEKGMLRKGSTIFVDNVRTKKPMLKDYLNMVKGAHTNAWKTQIHDVKRPYQDAVALSTYLGVESLEL